MTQLVAFLFCFSGHTQLYLELTLGSVLWGAGNHALVSRAQSCAVALALQSL